MPLDGVLTWPHLIVVGLGFDAAGVVIVAWSLAATTASKISHDVPIHGISFGLPHIALGSARQRAEARLGMTLLVGGFLLQALAYFFPHPEENLDTGWERGVGAAMLVLTWVVAATCYRLYVPWSAARVYDAAQKMQHRPS